MSFIVGLILSKYEIDAYILPVIELSSSEEEIDEMEQEVAVLTSGKLDRINNLELRLN